MERIEKTFEINSPVRTVYNQWTQFEEFPLFMEGIEEVQQLDDTHLHWRAQIAGKRKEWDSEIVEQIPDQRIAWRATAGVPNSGSVRFEQVAQGRTRVKLTMEYEPQGLVEKIADSVGIVSHKVENAVEKFKDLVEQHGESGAWRGEVQGGQKISPAPGSAAQGPGGTTPMPGAGRRKKG